LEPDYRLVWQKIITSAYLLRQALILAWLLYVPAKGRYLKSRAAAEIKRLQKANELYQKFRYNIPYKITNFMDNHKVGFLVTLICIASIALYVSNHAPLEFTIPYAEG
jgi:hypothetical protein